ncbi:family 16 glycosylhydrolase, partial [Sulfitobacter aestuarii]
MFDITKFSDNFDNFSEDFWFISDFVVAAQWNQTGWNETYLTSDAGEVTLTFDGADIEGKPYSGAEFQSDHFYGYGSYEVEMMPSGESGVVSSFFLFTNTLFGADRHNEIDIEFLGGDTSVMNVNYFYGNEKLGDNGSVQIPLGFDAADALHVYRIDWQPDSIRWYADDALIYEIESGSGSVPIPDEAMKIYANIWTGGTGLEHWHGPIAPDASTQAVYSSVSYTPYTVTPSDAGGDAVSFAGHDQALIIDLAADTYAKAPRIMAIGDSLTEGWVHSGHPSDPPAERDGYRLDLWEHILANGGWTDYVGPLVTGPDTMPDRDHAGVGGKHLAAIVDDGNGPSDFSEALADEVPDIVLFMAGTNDFQNNGEDNFRNVDFPEIISGIAAAVSQFYAVTGSAEKYLVISTLPPKVKAGVPFEYASYLNEGYSIVDNQMVAGDANNGTYVKGLIATVTELQAQHPTLILFHNPVTTMEDISPDLIHFSNLGYQHYAEALFALLESEIGLTDGYLANIAETLAPAREAIGGEAGDRIGGDAQDNILRGRGGADFLEGRGGADTLEGGTGLDTFAYGLDALDGATDRITDYSAADGDVIDLGAIIDSFGWDASEIAANVTVSDVSGGAEVAITTPSGTFVLALVENVAASEIRLATTQFTENYTPLEELVGTSGNDSIYDGDRSLPIYGLAGDDNLNGAGGNDTLEGGPGLDRLTGGSGADVFRYKAADLDGRRDIIEDFSIAEGDKVDISQIGSFYGWSASELMDRLSFRDTSGGDLQLKINLPSGTVSFALIRDMDETSFLAAKSLILEGGAPPDTGDDDGNMQLSAPDT